MKSTLENAGSYRMLCCANTQASLRDFPTLYPSFILRKYFSTNLGGTEIRSASEYSPDRAFLMASKLKSVAKIWIGDLLFFLLCS
jgi:hypothetical protein